MIALSLNSLTMFYKTIKLYCLLSVQLSGTVIQDN